MSSWDNNQLNWNVDNNKDKTNQTSSPTFPSLLIDVLMGDNYLITALMFVF